MDFQKAVLVATLPPTAAQILCLDDIGPTLAAQPETNPVSAVQPHHLAYVIYTSGSTGRPKGVMIVHRGLTNYLSWALAAYPVADGCGAPVQSSLSFDATITSLWTPLLAGKKVVLVPEHGALEALSALLQAETPFSLVKLTPAHLKALSLLQPQGTAPHGTHAFIIGGEALFAQDVALWRRAAPQIRLVNEYGPTETVVGCCVYTVPDEALESGTISIGRPIANTQLYVLDPHRQPVPIGVVGELYIGGDGVARGYLNRPELTAEKFIANPFGPGRLYQTGDRVRWLPDGNLEYLGRLDNQVKVRGFRIELGEIEAVLCQHPAVQAAVVIVWHDAPGEQRLVAYVVTPQAATPSLITELRAFLGERLPAFMLPAAFVGLDALPLTPNGKVDRKALPAPTAQKQSETQYVAPQNEHERHLIALWQAVLQLERVGVHDNFFELGGHSLLLIQLHRRLQERYGKQVTVMDLFRYPTVAALAAHLSRPHGTADNGQPDVALERVEARQTQRSAGQRQRQLRQQVRREEEHNG